MSLVTKVRETAGGLYGQARARYAASPSMQKAGQQAGHAASQLAGKIREASGKASSGQTAARIREMSGKASSSELAGKVRGMSGKASSSELAGKVRGVSGKAAAAVKDARARRPDHR